MFETYWVNPGHVMAGEYPGSLGGEDPRPKLRWLLDAGVSTFVDLTEESELEPYTTVLGDEAGRLGTTADHLRWPIPDMTPPAAETMIEILDAIESAVDVGEVVYVHCMAGLGRTGAVVGCYLVRRGMSGRQALSEIACLRDGLGGGPLVSPYTAEQRDMVRTWTG